MLSALILAVSIGATVQFHYCGHLLRDVVVIGELRPCCGELENMKGCCHDEKVEIKSDPYSKATITSTAVHAPFILRPISFQLLDFNKLHKAASLVLLIKSPDSHPPALPDVLALIQTFLI